MTVKSKVGRKRYVAFSVSEGMTKEAIIRGLRSAGLPDPPYVVQCSSGKAVLRCTPDKREGAIAAMSRVDPRSSPLSTSGTLRGIRRRHPELIAAKRRGPRVRS
ncbi:MAG: hypothetical protein FWH47_01050 [Methanomassiliicoccaceae archaeon]|nr:hypothetical protein [Methanomassiliicoccaceae archaeon]